MRAKSLLLVLAASLPVAPAFAQTVPAPVSPDIPAAQTIIPAPVQTPDPAMGGNPTDTSSKTCQTTMPMLQALSCALYPAQVQAFCQQYQPKLMDMAHCQSAEKYAQNVPPSGQHKSECMKQTFNMGTSSWSFVLACAKTTSSQGATGSGQNALYKVGMVPTSQSDPPDGVPAALAQGDATAPAPAAAGAQAPTTPGVPGGATSLPSAGQIVTPTAQHGANPSKVPYDSQCTQKLQAMGAKFSPQGQVGSGICTVKNQVLYTSKVATYTGKMDCMLALLFEKWNSTLQSEGITKLDNFGTVNCRLMNNGRSASSTYSVHSFGFAADISGFTVNGTHIAGAEYFTNFSNHGQILRAIVNGACETFNGVLAYNFYGGAAGISHMHVQYSGHYCDPAGSGHCATCRAPSG